ncbi:hypothetical protein GcM3_215021 [Golovinomyces cichoracearum]|uniref:Uncharacterized protein n=1 Tax=Golovinomyces cichoracearum TaxID=62708 RepID=A0A420H8T7_9PEZI|nr:hypothetical protein GcM3_215021 [Golovinomyces cichoracearum]
MPTYITPSHDSLDIESIHYSSQEHHKNSIPAPITRSESGSSSQDIFFEIKEMSRNLGDIVSNPVDSRLSLENTVTVDPQSSNELRFAAQELQNATRYIQKTEERAKKSEIKRKSHARPSKILPQKSRLTLKTSRLSLPKKYQNHQSDQR